MNSPIKVKICGLTRKSEVDAALVAGADYLGFAHFPKSPRHVELDAARNLALRAKGLAKVVVLAVDPDDAGIEEILEKVSPDLIQLHGRESPQRVAEIKLKFKVQIMKAVGICSSSDLGLVDEHACAADQLLVDAKPAAGAEVPGGNGLTFDWRLIEGVEWPVPWMLAGGLNSSNVSTAIRLTRATRVDVSSGVESEPGRKDLSKISSFVSAAKEAGHG